MGLSPDAMSVACLSTIPDLDLTLSKFLRPNPFKESKPPPNLDEASTTFFAASGSTISAIIDMLSINLFNWISFSLPPTAYPNEDSISGNTFSIPIDANDSGLILF